MRGSRSEGLSIIKNRFIIWVATGGGTGYSPIAPGTCGSIVGLFLFLPLALLPLTLYGLVLAGIIALGVWSAGEAEVLLASKDASCIVIDEIAGILLAYMAVPMSVAPLLVGLVLFRLFDIIKPVPRLEVIPGGWGVMLDDLLAGLLAQAGVRLLLLLSS